jgi:hypothetical protein
MTEEETNVGSKRPVRSFPQDEERYEFQNVGGTRSVRSFPDEEERFETRTEVINVRGDRLVSQVKDIVRQGNAFRITVKDQKGGVLFDIPVGLGVVGTALFPSVAALSIVGVMVANLRIVVEKRAETDASNRC